MLVVHIAEGERSVSDLTARARIRDAAIECFAEEGFDTPFRTIADRAGFSPGLITHHFGSKSALRADCDAEVLRRYRAIKSDAVARPSAHLLEGLTAPGRVRDDPRVHPPRDPLRRHPRAGLPRPAHGRRPRGRWPRASRPASCGPHATRRRDCATSPIRRWARCSCSSSPCPGPRRRSSSTSLRAGQRETILPMLELFTEGLLADRQLLDDYLHYLWEPPDVAEQPPRTPHPRPAERGARAPAPQTKERQ